MAKSSYLCFHKGKRHLAIENNEILRISPVQPLYPLPLSIPAVDGLMLLEDELVAVVDLVQAAFHDQPTETNYYIFIQIAQEIIGISADAIDGIKDIDDSTWEPYGHPLLPFINQEEDILYLIHLN